MPTLRFEGREIPYRAGDTLATALYRAGVRTFTRSFKLHRPRGLYCLSGDCPNCLVNVDGLPGLRACVTPARACEVHREGGVPSTRFDLLRILERLHRLMPVGFYYKAFIRPRWMWPVAERIIQRATGVGRLPLDRPASVAAVHHASPDLVVVGAGLAGLSAAVEAAGAGASVLICDERGIGEGIADPELLARIDSLASRANELGVEVVERATALGIYEGPLVPIASQRGLIVAHPTRVVVATGATDRHEVFAGNDLPGVWQGRAAATLVARHGLRPGGRAVVVAGGPEAPDVVRTLADGDVEIAAVVVPAAPGGAEAAEPPAFGGAPVVAGEVVLAHGRDRVRAVTIRANGREERVRCDAVVLSRALVARDVLWRMRPSDPVVVAVGDLVDPGAGPDEIAAAGRRVAGDGGGALRDVPAPPVPRDGIVCLCEDVSVADVVRAAEEGFGSSELLKRYTTASMGPCQGVQCGRYVAAMARSASTHPGVGTASAPRTTARPPARAVALEQIAGSVHEDVERRTALHAEHLAAGGHLGPSGAWVRPFHYGDARAEYEAVRERVSIMDVSTLGKLRIVGPDATAFVDHIVPGRVADLEPGRARYVLLLDDAGYVTDDGMLVARRSGGYLLTTTSGGAERTRARLEHVTYRRADDVHILDLTEVDGAILVAGPRARALLMELTDDDVSPEGFPYMAERRLVVAGVPCHAIRVGFVGELSFELHHPRDRSVELWTALREAGAPFDLVPHGLDALDVLRLEKGHVYIGQDSLPDDTPGKLGLSRMVDLDKGAFVGRTGLLRLLERPSARSLVGLAFSRGSTPDGFAGQPIWRDDGIIGRVTSCEYSPTLDTTIGLGWLRASGSSSGALRVGEVEVRRVPTPFLDPDGVRVRG